jgi:flagellar motor switch protein FliM
MMAEEQPAAEPASISDEEVAALLEKKEGEEAPGAVRPYDLMSQRINRTQLPLLESVNKTFATRACQSLSALLGRDASVHFDSIESVKCAEMQVSLPSPASLAVIRLKPLNGFGYISVEPQLLLTLLDGFFGGTGRANTDMQAAVAPAAQRFLSLMLRNFAPDIAAAWLPVTPVEMELVKQETNPRLVHFGAAAESVIACKFTVEFAACSGSITLLLPDALLAPVRETLSGDGGPAAPKQPPWGPSLGAALCEAQIDTHAVLAEATLSLRELVTMARGDIIPIDPPEHVTLLAGDVPLYQGRFGISQGRNALKILAGAAS